MSFVHISFGERFRERERFKRETCVSRQRINKNKFIFHISLRGRETDFEFENDVQSVNVEIS